MKGTGIRGWTSITADQWRRLRQMVQTLSFLLFLYLLLGTQQQTATVLPHDLFFRLDPLAGLGAMIAGRQWIPALALGLVTALLTLLFGRVWCGWLCPMGTTLDWTRLRRDLPDERDLHFRWRQAKYLILFVVVFAALMGNLTLLVLDPVTLLFRTITVALLPALDVVVTAAEKALYNVEVLRGPVEGFDGLVRDAVLPVGPHFYEQSLLIGLVFLGIVALNAVRPRFWCRYLCPLGALLGLISKVGWLRHRVDKNDCIECGRCVRVCPTGTVDPERGFTADPSECTLCLDCESACPSNAVGFRGLLGLANWQRYDPSRRQAIASLGVTVLGVGLLRSVPSVLLPHNWLIRPPGAREDDILSKCIRCGECIRVCPTGGLQPGLGVAGWEGLWTPVLVPRLGYCDYSCNACGQVCPTGVIPRLDLEQKRQTVIGLAYIDRDRCIPWADGRDCIVCEEMCPVPDKAIFLEERTLTYALGGATTVRCPHVIRERCIGCGICEAKCPIKGKAAIRVYLPS